MINTSPTRGTPHYPYVRNNNQGKDEPRNLKLEEGAINTQTALCTKQYQWEYKNEARLIACEPDADGAFHSIHFDEGSHIEKIYFGLRFNSCQQK